MKKSLIFLLFLLIPFFSNGAHWQRFANDSVIYIHDAFYDNSSSELFAIAGFVKPNGDTINSPALWMNDHFEQLGSYDFGIGGNVNTLIRFQDTIFIGGFFQQLNGAPGNYLLKLNAQANYWDTLNYSPDMPVWNLDTFENRLIVEGVFRQVGPISSTEVIQYSSGQWYSVPLYSIGIGVIKSSCVHNDSLVLAGDYGAQYPSNYLGNIFLFKSDSLFPVSNGVGNSTGSVNYGIRSVKSFQGKMYVGGDFSANEGRNLLVYNGANWEQVGGASPDPIWDMEVFQNELYVVGQFTSINGMHASHIAKWDGSSWCSLGSELDGTVYSITTMNNELLLSGDFTQIDGQNFNHIARWTGGSYSDTCFVVGVPENLLQNMISIYPTVCHGYFNYKSGISERQIMVVYDLLGNQKLLEEVNYGEMKIDINFLSSGVYFVKSIFGNQSFVKMIVKE
ncbi:MAG: T9SS type A sorting domain-containing protein [Bacteroidetes bacterium]|nr:T9SS type A sorting domain-containing protein [Bacteroidota bacterium]